MLACMVDSDDLIIQILRVDDAAEVGELNQRAVDMDSGYTWREMTPYEIGLFVGFTLPALGGFRNE